MQDLLTAADDEIEEHVLRGVKVLTARRFKAWLEALRAEKADEEPSDEDINIDATTKTNRIESPPVVESSDNRAYENALSRKFARLQEVCLERTKDRSCWEVYESRILDKARLIAELCYGRSPRVMNLKIRCTPEDALLALEEALIGVLSGPPPCGDSHWTCKTVGNVLKSRSQVRRAMISEGASAQVVAALEAVETAYVLTQSEFLFVDSLDRRNKFIEKQTYNFRSESVDEVSFLLLGDTLSRFLEDRRDLLFSNIEASANKLHAWSKLSSVSAAAKVPVELAVKHLIRFAVESTVGDGALYAAVALFKRGNDQQRVSLAHAISTILPTCVKKLIDRSDVWRLRDSEAVLKIMDKWRKDLIALDAFPYLVQRLQECIDLVKPFSSAQKRKQPPDPDSYPYRARRTWTDSPGNDGSSLYHVNGRARRHNNDSADGYYQKGPHDDTRSHTDKQLSGTLNWVTRVGQSLFFGILQDDARYAPCITGRIFAGGLPRGLIIGDRVAYSTTHSKTLKSPVVLVRSLRPLSPAESSATRPRPMVFKGEHRYEGEVTEHLVTICSGTISFSNSPRTEITFLTYDLWTPIVPGDRVTFSISHQDTGSFAVDVCATHSA